MRYDYLIYWVIYYSLFLLKFNFFRINMRREKDDSIYIMTISFLVEPFYYQSRFKMARLRYKIFKDFFLNTNIGKYILIHIFIFHCFDIIKENYIYFNRNVNQNVKFLLFLTRMSRLVFRYFIMSYEYYKMIRSYLL